MNVKLRKDMMIVVLNEKTFIFNFVTLKLIEQVDTYPNPTGLCALSQAEKPISKIICLPGQEKGSLKVLNYGKSLFVGFYTLYSCGQVYRPSHSSSRHRNWSHGGEPRWNFDCVGLQKRTHYQNLQHRRWRSSAGIEERKPLG